MRRMGMLLGLFGVVLGGDTMPNPNGRTEAVAAQHGVLLVVPPTYAPRDASSSAGRPAALARVAARYLESITGSEPRVQRVASESLESLVEKAGEERAGLVIVLGAERFAPERIDAERMLALGDSGFVLETFEAGSWNNDLGSRGATFVLLAANTALARQYAVYELMRRFGARFFHPEQEYVPLHERDDLRELAARPTALHREGQDYVPDFAWRSWSFHGAHPLEILEAFSDGEHPIDEARNVADWIVKNRGNRFRGLGRGIAPPPAQRKRAAELEALRRAYGFPQGVGITLHNEQQGASAEVDRSQGAAKAQIEALVARKLEAHPDAAWLSIHFGPTEFTTTPDRETVQWLDWAGAAALALRPDIEVEINDHITGSQPTKHFDDLGCPSGTNEAGRSDYYDLAFHTDPRLGVSVHTVMFYPLEGAANVYNQKTFAHKQCLMKKASDQGRPLVYFPEGSWWLSFDNAVPIYLPIYLWSRGRDIEQLRPLLAKNGGTLRGHRMFNSGQEWGYWQQDYVVGLWAWNADVPMKAVLGEICDPLCEPRAWREGCHARATAVAVLEAVMEHQRAFFLERPDWRGRTGGLVAYFSGEDEADRIAARSGYEFRPVSVPLHEVMRWDLDALEHFERTDLAALGEAAGRYAAWVEQLEALRADVPDAGRPWLDEVVDGLQIDGLRARHAAASYRAVVSLRRATLDGVPHPAEAAAPARSEAEAALREARAVIARREAAYRYPAPQTVGGGITSATAKPNGTTYPYRLYTKTHLLAYWQNRQAAVERLLESSGEGARLSLGDAIAAPGREGEVHWPHGATGWVQVGKQTRVDEHTRGLSMHGAVGAWEVHGRLQVASDGVEVKGAWVRAEAIASTPTSRIELVEPRHPAAQTVLTTVFPALEWAWLPKQRQLALAPDPDRDERVEVGDVVVVDVREAKGELQTHAFSLMLPVAVTAGGEPLHIELRDVVVEFTVRGDALGSRAHVRGSLRVDDVVHALVELAGYDRRGAFRTLSRILAFDPDAPPPTVPFAANVGLVPQ